MDFLIILAIQFSLMIVGFLFSISLGIKNKIESLGISYLLGSALITILFLINHIFFELSLGPINFLISIAFSSVLFFLYLNVYKKEKSIFKIDFIKINQLIKSLNCFEKFIVITLIFIFLYTLFENYYWPVTDWDSLALYDFRARVMAINGNMLEGVELGYFFQYPPYTSFLHLFGYIFGDERVRIVYSFIYFSLIATFYSLLRRTQLRWITLIGSLMLSVDTFIFRHSTMAYTNLSYVVFLSLGLIYLSFWFLFSKKKDFLVGAMLVGLSTWVRASDPFWYIGILIIIAGTIKNKKNYLLSLGAILGSVGIYKFWDYFVKGINITSDASSRETRYLDSIMNNNGVILKIIQTLPEIIIYFSNNLFYVIGYLIPIFFISIYYDLKNKNKLNIFLYIVVGVSIVLILVGIIIFSLFYDTWNQIADSLQRLSMVLIPLMIFLIFNSEAWKSQDVKNK